VGTQAFAAAVIARLGQVPLQLPSVCYTASEQAEPLPLSAPLTPRPQAHKELVGVDVFLHWRGTAPEELALRLQKLGSARLKLALITNRGVKVWPGGMAETFCTDHWRCRFVASGSQPVWHGDILALLAGLDMAGLDFIKTEHLYEFDGVPGFALGQGQ
jgi:isocitrate dehydrogenase